MDHPLPSAAPEAIRSLNWMDVVARYREPDLARSLLEIALTVIPFAALWVAAWLALSVGYWLTLLIAVPAAAFLVRLFLIQHDCGHSAFFRTRAANDWIGRVLGVLTLTPYDVWRRNHAIHHATSGNLDRRGIGDVRTLTVAEYRALGWLQKLNYRAYRHPLVMFGLGPAYVFLIQQRLPLGQMQRAGWTPWISAMGTNAGILAASLLMIWLVGLEAFLMVHVPIVLFGATLGVWLFYVQHQFEDTFWSETSGWSHQDAALYGSSFYDLPKPLHWLTANIGMHHVHHLSSRIPYYRLPQVLKDYPELTELRPIGILESLRLVKLKLWDEEQRRLVSFREAQAVS